MFVVYLARLLQRRVWQAPMLAMFSVTFAGTLFTQLLAYGYLTFSGASIPLSDSVGVVTLPSLLLNMLFAIPVHALMRDLARWVYPLKEAK
jgi:cell shape-determining protein MreD